MAHPSRFSGGVTLGHHMDYYDEYLRGQAVKYRELAEREGAFDVKIELLELAAVCEDVANNFEDCLTAG